VVYLKLGQVAGVLIMGAGFASFLLGAYQYTGLLMTAGSLLYAGCRITAWLKAKT
jgi:hypothetical protein